MRCLLLLLAALVTSVSGQCSYSTPCRTCLSDPRCYYSVSCNYCSSYNDNCNGIPSTTNAALCPVEPTAVDAARPLSTPYWTLSIAFVAAGALVALSYSPLERFCGQRLVAGSAHRGFGCSSYLLLFACWCLWFGFSLSLSAPALPWLVAATISSTAAATAFNIYNCFIPRDGASSYCYIFTTMDFVNGNLAGSSSPDAQWADQGYALGIVGYIAGLGLLFPCAVMASFAVYRLRRFEKTGIPPYTSGCSPSSLAVAQMLGWPAFIIFSIVVFIATSLCSTITTKVNNFNSNPFNNGKVEYLLMPGPVSAGVSIAFQFLGLTLLAVVSRSLSSVHGVGCNGGGCCRLAMDDSGLDSAAPAYAPPQDGNPLIYAERAPAAASYNKTYNGQPPNATSPMLSVGSA